MKCLLTFALTGKRRRRHSLTRKSAKTLRGRSVTMSPMRGAKTSSVKFQGRNLKKFVLRNIFCNRMMLISTLLHILLKTNFFRFLPWNLTDDVLTLLPRNFLADFLVNECRQRLFPVNANVKRHFMAFIPRSLDIATISYRNFLTLAYLNNCAILFRHGS